MKQRHFSRVGDCLAISLICVHLIIEVRKRVENVKVNKESAMVLKERVEVIGKVLERGDKSEMQASALISLKSALESAKQLVEDCAHKKHFLLVQSVQVVERFSAVFDAIDQAVVDLNLSLGVDIFEGLQDALENDVKQLSEIQENIRGVQNTTDDVQRQLQEELAQIRALRRCR